MRLVITALCLLFVVHTTVRADASAPQRRPDRPDDNRAEAQRLWELAIAAKGGRERLYAIENLQYSVRRRDWWGLQRASTVIEALYVFPEKSWVWSDQRPTIFGLVIQLQNYEDGIHLGYVDRGKGGSVDPIYDMGRGGLSDFFDTQLNYFMETKWVKPIPVSVESGKINGRAVDIVNTVVRDYPKGKERVDEKVSFALDRKSHLPLKVIYYIVALGEAHPGGPNLSDYAEVNGIQMSLNFDGNRTTYQFNVEYDPRVFQQPPSEQSGIDAWKKK
jgi:hypothetical protein